MNYKISTDKNTLTIFFDEQERANLRELETDGRNGIVTDAAMFDCLEPLICNSELQWVNPDDTGDLTSAPMLGIMGEEGVKGVTVFAENFGLIVTGFDGKNTMAAPIIARWAFMDYAVRSPLEDLRDTGKAVFVGGYAA